ncbi:MAG: ribonuclease III [Verrucomicrobiota bacterium]|nr:ribonuclease III [Verrucomicrobiota bacterium]
MKTAPLEKLQSRLGYYFRNGELLRQALRHPSFISDSGIRGDHNQRLEFLGDALLGAILAERLYHEFPQHREGQLSRNRSILARGHFLACLARDLGLPECLELGVGENNTGGRQRESNLEDALEALVGAIYLDSDWDNVRGVVLHWYGNIASRLETQLAEENPKGRLQELVQSELGNDVMLYTLKEVTGPDHLKQFAIALSIGGEVLGNGRGNSKKEAEENAAREALVHWLNKPKAQIPQPEQES